jgi:lipoate-protein ligase B
MQLWVINLGHKDYKFTLDLQRKLWGLRIENKIPNILILVEHDHTITLGKNSTYADLLLSQEEMQQNGLSIYEAERGGKCTYHGPGQLVAYPIMLLEGEVRNLSLYIEKLEEVMIQTVRKFGIEGTRRANYIGVWVGHQKIGSIGIAVKKWVTYHGFALNVNSDLSFFRFINPCGEDWKVITSMQQILARKVDMESVISATIHNFKTNFKAEVIIKNEYLN